MAQSTINPYGAEAVIFNSAPFINLALQQQAKEQAKGEAIDKYFQDMGKSLTPAGMSANDVDPFLKRVNGWKEFTIQHKDALRNPALDGGRAMAQANYMYNDALAHAEKSKSKVANLKEYSRMTPDQRERLSDASLQAYQRAAAPVDSEDYDPLTPDKLNYNPKPFDLNMQKAFYGNLTSGIKMGDLVESDVVGKDGRRTTTIKSTYEPEALGAIYQRANAAYSADPSVQFEFNKRLKNPEYISTLNPAFKSAFGRDIQSTEDAVAAIGLSGIETERRAQKVADDAAFKQQRQLEMQKTMEAIRHGNRISEAKFKQQLKGTSDGEKEQILDSLINDIEDDARTNGVRNYKTKAGEVSNEYAARVSPNILEIFAVKDEKGHDVLPDDVYFMGDGNIRPVFYRRNEKGQLESGPGGLPIDTELSKPVLRKEFKAQLGKKLLGVQGLTRELKGGSRLPAKPVSKKNDPLNLGL